MHFSVGLITNGDVKSSYGNKGRTVLAWLAAGIAAFHIWANTFGNLSDLWRNSLHLGMLGLLGYILYPTFRQKKAGPKSYIWGIIPGCLIFMVGLYVILFEGALHARNEEPILWDLVFAGIALVLALELARRTSGYVIPTLAVILLTYVLWWGSHIGGVFSFRGMTLSRVLYRMYFTDEGLFGMITSISSTYVFMFILFAAFLLRSGGGDFIISLARKLTHRITGGPGLVAVLASGLMGTISGSAVANTVSTGSITIPLMKNAGFSPRFAAAVESASSTGGQLMPPIMGAGAFLMAQWTQIPFAVIIGAALLPALLYFCSVGFTVYLEAKKTGLDKLPRDPSATSGNMWLEGIQFFLPVICLIVLLILGFTPTYTAGFAILVVVAASWLKKETRMGVKEIIGALETGTRNMLATGILLVVSGVIVGIINMTGISITFSQLVIGWSGMQLLPALALIAGASLLLGMGLPVTAAYIMIAILTVPALTTMGVPVLAAHMIIFWFSQDSNVTPPVCLASFAAASIAGSRPMRTGLTSWKLAKGLYVLPLLFASTSLISGGWGERLLVFPFALAGLYAFAVALSGFMFKSLSIPERGLMLGLAAGLFWPGPILINIFSLILLLIFGLLNKSPLR